MRHSTQRYLTTHTGSLPRPDDLVHMMHARESGVPVDRAALAARVREAVKMQTEAGIDLVSDGEISKPSYAPISRLASLASAGRATPLSTKISPSFRAWRSAYSATPVVRGAGRQAAMGQSACATQTPPGNFRRSAASQPARLERAIAPTPHGGQVVNLDRLLDGTSSHAFGALRRSASTLRLLVVGRLDRTEEAGVVSVGDLPPTPVIEGTFQIIEVLKGRRTGK
jgi:hypothetical protein